MINFEFDKLCYSCSACKNICPVDAIEMLQNGNGNFIPMVNTNKCINCEKCSRICPALNASAIVSDKLNATTAYAAYNKCTQEREKSSSGGIFILAAKQILKEGGYVCGCVWDKDFIPQHIISNKLEDIYKMMGSKYVQSDLNNTFLKIKELLSANEKVLFTGTPCQVSGLYNFIGDNENLFVISLICHGVISTDVWKRHIEKTNTLNLKNIFMKDKTLGWAEACVKYSYSNNKEILEPVHINSYIFQLYIKGFALKERCFACNHKGDNIKADMIIGDFWGMGKDLNKYNDDKGMSCVVVLSKKGETLLDNIKNQLFYKEVCVDKILNGNPRILKSLPIPKKFYEFREAFENSNFSEEKLYTKYILCNNTKRVIKQKIKLILFKSGIYKIYYDKKVKRRKYINE